MIYVPLLDDAVYEGTETFFVNLSNPIGGTIADGQGVGTIIDNDLPPTKFYVVDDATANKTFEYGATGAAIENYVVNSGNSAPRGAASTVAGDKVWTVDANKNIYVYNTSGGLLGLWAAGSLASNATVEGITTNGTDVWIVDARQDKVFRYTSAGSRLSGSQNAASSFSLNGSNTDPKDLVTDGTSIWVVNDNTTDKVFKYNASTGALLGSWTITSGGGSPTGITIDPASVTTIWTVDSTTDRVYQYDNAASRTSGSQAASTSFALAAGNSNPQGIADPPVGAPASEVAARHTAEVGSAPGLAGFQVFSATGQKSTETSNQHNPDGLVIFVSDFRNPAALLPDNAGVKTEVSMEGSRLSSTYDDALCDIADELDSVAPLNGQKTRVLR
jgi:hypothetical protein